MKDVKTGVLMLGMMALLATPTLAIWERGMGVGDVYSLDEAVFKAKGTGYAQIGVIEGTAKIENAYYVAVDRNKDTEVKYFGNGRIVRGIQWTEYYDFDKIIVNGKDTIVAINSYDEEPATITAKGIGSVAFGGIGWYFAKELN